MTFYLILFFIGGFIFVTSMFNSGSYGALVFDRNYFCPEKYRKVQKATDIISIVHNVAVMAFGAFVMAFSILHVTVLKGSEYNVNLVHSLYRISLILMVVDFVISIYLNYKHKMANVRDEIWNQWETQKVVTKDNDHEVNLYRGCKRITNTYPYQIASISIALMIFGLFI